MARYNNNNGSRDNRGGRDGNRSQGGDRSSRRNQRKGKRSNRNRNDKNKGQKSEPKAVMTYRKAKVGDEKVTTKFTLYSETEAIKIEHQKYTGVSDYELIRAHRELWAMIDDNELLPVRTGAPDRTRKSQANVIGVYSPPLPDPAVDRTAYDNEVEKRSQHEKQMRKVAFRAARNIYADETAATAFGSALEQERDRYSALPSTRSTANAEFYSKQALENILNEVTREILGVDAVVNQLKYLKTVKKPRDVTCKAWFRSLAEIEKCINWYSDQNYEIDQMVRNQDMIVPNIPIEWLVDFEKTKTHQDIMRNTSNNQPSRAVILEELERLERAEGTKREIERVRGDREKKRSKGERNGGDNNSSNWCRKPGHNHLWKDCPDNPRSTKRNEGRGRASDRENNQIDRQRDDSGERENEDRSIHFMDRRTVRFCPDQQNETYAMEASVPESENYEETEELEYVSHLDDDDDEEEICFLFENMELIEKENLVIEEQTKSEGSSTPTSMPGLEEHEWSSDEESSSDSEKESHIANLVKRRVQPDKENRDVLRANCTFSLKGKDGKRATYLGLFDTGSTGSLISEMVAKRHKFELVKDVGVWNTNAGKFKTREGAKVKDLGLPEFSAKRTIPECTMSMNPNGDQKYAAIFGMDFLVANGIDFINSQGMIEWDGVRIPIDDGTRARKFQSCNALDKRNIADNQYKQMTASEIVELENQAHLSKEEKRKLEQVLEEFGDLFKGKVGTRPGIKVAFELKQDARPFYSKPYSIPVSLQEVTKNAINMMVEQGILREARENTEWASPTFAVPKKTVGVRIVSDFRRLNGSIKRSPWPMPTTRELLHKVGGMTYVTALDQILSYYTLEMDPKTWKYLTIILPWGKYQYKKMPMGLNISADVFQREMTKLFEGLDFVMVYIDDVLIVTKSSFDDHLKKLRVVLQRMLEKGIQLEAKKSFFGAHQVEYLGYIITREGLKPQPEKVRAILNMGRPSTVRQLRGFVGLVNFYRDLWKRRAHFLAPLTSLITKKKGPVVWTEEAEQAFKKVKEICAKDALLFYPNFNERFDIYTDSSERQMGGMISQNSRPVAYWSKKLSSAQQKYPTTEQELLAIVELLKEFRSMLLGQRIRVYTDHKNLTYEGTKHGNDRVLRQRLVLEEFGPELVWLAGEKNVAADMLSRIPQEEEAACKLNKAEVEAFQMDAMAAEQAPIPIDYQAIHAAQRDDLALKELRDDKNVAQRFRQQKFGSTEVWMKQSVGDSKWRIYVPKASRTPLMQWFHDALMHPGAIRMEESVRRCFTWEKCRDDIREFIKTCEVCQKTKSTNKQKQGKLPLKDAPVHNAFDVLTVDLCGPWAMEATVQSKSEVKTKKGKAKKKIEERIVRVQVWALTMVDEASSWIEIVPIKNKRSENVSMLVDAEWFCRYPRPLYVIHDNGTEFVGSEFQELLESYGVKSKPTTVKNPQANAVHERVHLLMAEMLRTQKIVVPVDVTVDEEIRRLLQSVAFAIRATSSTITKHSSAELVYGRDMIMHQQSIVDWNQVRERKRDQQVKDNVRENKKRTDYKWKVGDLCLIVTKPDERKGKLLDHEHRGPYEIVKVNENGTVKIRCANFEETINIRRLDPFYKRNTEE